MKAHKYILGKKVLNKFLLPKLEARTQPPTGKKTKYNLLRLTSPRDDVTKDSSSEDNPPE